MKSNLKEGLTLGFLFALIVTGIELIRFLSLPPQVNSLETLYDGIIIFSYLFFISFTIFGLLGIISSLFLKKLTLKKRILIISLIYTLIFYFFNGEWINKVILPGFYEFQSILVNIIIILSFVPFTILLFYALYGGLKKIKPKLILIFIVLISISLITSINLNKEDVNVKEIDNIDYPKIQTNNKIILIGLDGADWKVINPLIEQNKLPNIKSLMNTGSYGELKYEIGDREVQNSPPLWTTILTGQKISDHGLTDFFFVSYPKTNLIRQKMVEFTGWFNFLQNKLLEANLVKRFPLSNNLRKTKAIWNILTENNIESGFIGFWGTYPVDEVKGFMISDKLYPIDGLNYNNPTYPLNLNISSETPNLTQEIKNLQLDETLKLRMRFFEKDKLFYNIGQELISKDLDLFAIYLEGIDVASHIHGTYQDINGIPAPYEINEVTSEEWNKKSWNEVKKYANSVNLYYEYMDEIIGEIKKQTPDNTMIIVSDHGFDFSEGCWHHSKTHPGCKETPSAIVIINGKDINENLNLTTSSLTDITPTILYLLGLPIAEDMEGDLIKDAIKTTTLNKNPPNYINTYEFN